MAPRGAQREPREQHEQRERGGDLPAGQALCGVRVEDGQAARPEGLAEVGHVGHGGICEAREERELREIRHRAGAALCDQRHQAHARHQGEEGQLLQDRAPQRGRLPALRGVGASQPPEGPVVEQQQHEGQRHQRLLGEKPERQGREDQGDAPGGAVGAPARRVEEQRQHEEEP